VTPLPVTEAEAIVDALLTDPNNDLFTTAAEADLETSTETFTEYASMLNSLSQSPESMLGAPNTKGMLAGLQWDPLGPLYLSVGPRDLCTFQWDLGTSVPFSGTSGPLYLSVGPRDPTV
jgi:hypothetical protein